jgi:hypothetical protein
MAIPCMSMKVIASRYFRAKVAMRLKSKCQTRYLELAEISADYTRLAAQNLLNIVDHYPLKFGLKTVRLLYSTIILFLSP